MVHDMSSESSVLDRRAVVVAAILDVVASGGLERATVRQVAAAADVAIGTVQHYFPSKDAMLLAAFEEVVGRIRRRVAAVVPGGDVRVDLRNALEELLPLDERRAREVRVQVAFTARAAVEPALAELQARVLGEVRAALADGFARARGEDSGSTRCTDAATGALALVDGLALHAVSSRTPPDETAGPARRAVGRFLDDALR
jgi:AcrR family transcriptional regulator